VYTYNSYNSDEASVTGKLLARVRFKYCWRPLPVYSHLFPFPLSLTQPPLISQLKNRDLSRYVRWPRYVRIQRQKKILLQRLKVPPSINQFTRTLDKNQASELFKMLVKYQPETKAAKTGRLETLAAAAAAGENAASSAPPATLKYGLKHVTTLVEQKKAKLVVIPHDVDPIELVLWMPALCRKMGVPFAIVKGKSRLGTLTHKKTCSVVCLTGVNAEDTAAFNTLTANCKAQFNDNVERKWGGGLMGLKTQAKLDKRAKMLDIENAKKAGAGL
jgi:large subunit ribosomal protein L7Ae